MANNADDESCPVCTCDYKSVRFIHFLLSVYSKLILKDERQVVIKVN